MLLKNRLFVLSLISFFVYLMTILTFQNYIVSLLFVILQDLVLLILCLKNNILRFNSLFCVFLALSFETSSYLENSDIPFYGFKNLNFFGLSNSLILLLICSLILFIRNFKRIKYFLKTKSNNATIIKIFAMITVIALIIGLVNLFVGDNGANTSSEYIKVFLGEAYYGIFTFLNVFIFVIPFVKYKRPTIYKWYFFTIVSILLANCYVPYIAYILNIRGGYGGNLIFSLSKFAIPFLLLAPLAYKFKYNWFIYFSWFVGNIIPIVFFQAGTGKEILFLMIAIMLFVLIKVWRNTRNKGLIILCIVTSFVIGYILLSKLSADGTRLGDKANQVVSMFNFWKPNWLSNMPNSPKVRIYEFLSTISELLSKPAYFLFGKGYGGSFTDVTGYFYSIEPSRRESVFSLFEFENNYFYRVHETIIRLPLNFGFIGTFLILYLSVYRIRKVDMCSVLGCVWLLLFMNNSQTLTVLLIMAFFTYPSGVENKMNCSKYYRRRYLVYD